MSKEIVPYPQNAKEHPPKQVKLIAESIRRFGWQQPIVIDDNNVIVVGHGRWLAFTKYGDIQKHEEVWIVRNNVTIQGGQREKPLSEAEARAYRLMDNKIAESGWINDLLHEEVKFIYDDTGMKPEEMGFNNEILDIEEKTDFALPDGEKGIGSMSFVLANEQIEIIKSAIDLAKEMTDGEEIDTYDNDNGNGNALAFIVDQWINQQNERKGPENESDHE